MNAIFQVELGEKHNTISQSGIVLGQIYVGKKSNNPFQERVYVRPIAIKMADEEYVQFVYVINGEDSDLKWNDRSEDFLRMYYLREI
jgi:hypothetical protein